MKTELGFSFDMKKCVQCLGCEAACKTWRSVPLGMRWRRVLNVWEGEFPNVKCAGVSVSCRHCVEPSCVKACKAGALSKRESDGLVLVDTDKCVGCRACGAACPFGVPQFESGGPMTKCDMCYGDSTLREKPPCTATCPTGALTVRLMTAEEKQAGELALKKALDAVK